MSLQAYTRMDRGVAVVELDGKITLGDGASLLRDTLNQAIADGHKNILLDLEGVSYIDSAGLGELVGCNSFAKTHGATVRLVHLQKKIQGLLQITKLITLFDTFDDEDIAVRSFNRTTSTQL
jgi:anti-sigma B factor antagonist